MGRRTPGVVQNNAAKIRGGVNPTVAGVVLVLTVICLVPAVNTDKDAADYAPDHRGYIMFCPCMGRFGNQADHFLGTLGFAKGLDRTLILPPWIEYQRGRRGSQMVPFDSYYNVTQLLRYHRVITMEDFFTHLAERVWPKGNRISFCYTARRGPEENSCNAKDGNPFGPFWNTFNVNFDTSLMYGPMSYDVHHHNAEREWNKKYPPIQFPVLAFTGAPASFPVQKDNLPLQEYLQYNSFWQGLADNWIQRNLPRGRFVGIHLRNGQDWEKACEHTTNINHLFSSPQCLGYRNEYGQLSHGLCLPADTVIVEQVREAVDRVGAVAVFVASDNDHMIPFLSERLKHVTFHSQQEEVEGGEALAHLDINILAKSNYFIGNCVSSFTAFVARARSVEGLPTGFWGFGAVTKHNEL